MIVHVKRRHRLILKLQLLRDTVKELLIGIEEFFMRQAVLS
jgi:hypothetical protein